MKLGNSAPVNLGKGRISHGAWIVAGVAPVILGICWAILLRRERDGEE
jgi:hypothetical protein